MGGGKGGGNICSNLEPILLQNMSTIEDVHDFQIKKFHVPINLVTLEVCENFLLSSQTILWWINQFWKWHIKRHILEIFFFNKIAENFYQPHCILYGEDANL